MAAVEEIIHPLAISKISFSLSEFSEENWHFVKNLRKFVVMMGEFEIFSSHVHI